jgi:hypothetical protein
MRFYKKQFGNIHSYNTELIQIILSKTKLTFVRINFFYDYQVITRLN